MSFWNEIYGCVNYLNIPYETVMNLPVQIRKFWIKKHNQTVEEEKRTTENGNNSSSISGEALNSYARLEQNKQ